MQSLLLMLSYNVQTLSQLCYDICVKIFDVEIFQRNISTGLRNNIIKPLLSLASMSKYII